MAKITYGRYGTTFGYEKSVMVTFPSFYLLPEGRNRIHWWQRDRFNYFLGDYQDLSEFILSIEYITPGERDKLVRVFDEIGAKYGRLIAMDVLKEAQIRRREEEKKNIELAQDIMDGKA